MGFVGRLGCSWRVLSGFWGGSGRLGRFRKVVGGQRAFWACAVNGPGGGLFELERRQPEATHRFSRSPTPAPASPGTPPPPPPNHRLRAPRARCGPLRPIRLGTARSAAPPLEPRLWEGRPLYDRSIRIGCGFCTPKVSRGYDKCRQPEGRPAPPTWSEDERTGADQVVRVRCPAAKPLAGNPPSADASIPLPPIRSSSYSNARARSSSSTTLRSEVWRKSA